MRKMYLYFFLTPYKLTFFDRFAYQCKLYCLVLALIFFNLRIVSVLAHGQECLCGIVIY